MYEMIKLPYFFDDFDGYLSSTNIRNHYDLLYKSYVDNFNRVLSELKSVRDNNDYNNIKCLEKKLSFFGAGAILHTLFFENITPLKKDIPVILMDKLVDSFGSVDSFYSQFIKNIINIEGSGWGILGYTKSLDKLLILQCEKHQNLTIWDFEPLLVIDMWEHAYYLDYLTDKSLYASNMMELINWDVVNSRYLKVLNGGSIKFLRY